MLASFLKPERFPNQASSVYQFEEFSQLTGTDTDRSGIHGTYDLPFMFNRILLHQCVQCRSAGRECAFSVYAVIQRVLKYTVVTS